MNPLLLCRRDVTHRDLKLENILLEQKDDLSSIKIADFGLAKKSSRPLQTMCGTLYYVAPEVIKDDKEKFYTKSVDMWSAGVLLYVLLSARQPFASKNENQIFDKILSADFGFERPPWQEVSTEYADHLNQKMLHACSPIYYGQFWLYCYKLPSIGNW